MTHRPASSRPHTRRTLTTLSGLAVFLTAAISLAPAASAVRLPPPGGGGAPPPPPPSTTAATHFPLWAVIAIVAATVVLSVATTLVTLSLEQMHRARRTSAAAAEPQTGAQILATAAGPETEQGEILASHHYAADQDMHQTDSR